MKILTFILLTGTAYAAEVKIPKNAHAVDRLWGWECNTGYIQHRDKCIKVKIPKNAILNEDGHTWSCKPGFEKYRDVCGKKK